MTNSEPFFNQLKSERESQSIEISEICEFTKINSKYIEAIETGDFNLLPNVYMRLFLKAYADFIGADVEKALKDYELYTTGKIVQTKKNSTKIENKSPRLSIQSISKEIDSRTQISSKQIFSGIFVILIILVFLWWASKVTKEQSDNIQSNKTSQSINEKSSSNSKESIVKSNIFIKNELPLVLKKKISPTISH
jgi:cytoskeletal protein RodZ